MIRDVVLCDGRCQKELPKSVSCGRNQLRLSKCLELAQRNSTIFVKLTSAKDYAHDPNLTSEAKPCYCDSFTL